VSILKPLQILAQKPNQKRQWWNSSHFGWAIDVLCVAVLVIYFLHFALQAPL